MKVFLEKTIKLELTEQECRTLIQLLANHVKKDMEPSMDNLRLDFIEKLKIIE